MTENSGQGALDVDARYGRNPRATSRTRWIAIGTAVAFVIVFAAWVVWGGLFSPAASLETSDTGQVIVSTHEVDVTFELTVPIGMTSRCAVQALNQSYSIVGWKVFEVAASTVRTRSFTQAVRTTEAAVSGSVYRCWLT